MPDGPGPANPLKLGNYRRVCWGWFIKLRGRPDPIVLTACGRGSSACGRAELVNKKVDCPECVTKAALDPDLIKGGKE